MDNDQELTTPLDRFFTFWWILAGFAVFGLLALIAYLLSGKETDSVYEARMAERLTAKQTMVAAQTERLAEVKLDLAAGAKALSDKKVVASTTAVPGSPTHAKMMAEMAAKSEAPGALVVNSTISTALKPGELPLTYVEKELTAVAGSEITITFNNPDAIQHNLVLCKPGTADAVAALATEMMTKDAAGAMTKGFIPESDDIIIATKLLNGGESDTLKFTAPAEPGDYPYICTFPGHAMMRGVLKLTAK